MAGQGSLLDLMGPAEVQQAAAAAAAPVSPRSSGSLLTELNHAESRHRTQLQQTHAARLAEYEATQTGRDGHHHPGYAGWNAGKATTSRKPSQAEQLDLLAEELDQLKSRMRNRRPAPTPESHPPVESAPVAPPQNMLSGLFSFDSFVGTIARSWKLVFLCAVIGAVLAALYALTLPNKYQSIAEILIEPRGLKVLNNSVSPNGLNSEATVAYAESQVRIINSSSVIDPVIDELKLMDDPEFTEGSSAGFPFNLVTDLFNGGRTATDDWSAAKSYLFDNLYVRRVSQTFTIEIGVSTTDPAKSARIANALARAYMADESGARSSVARSASQDLTARLDELRQQVRSNEENVERYKAANGLVDANGRLVSEVQLSRLNEQMVLAKVQAGDARTRAKLAAEADLGDVISGSLPAELNNQTVSQLRLDYSRANARLEKLAAKLGQRHPDRIAAASERRSVLNAISQEMKRVVQTAQENYKRAKARQDDLASQVNQMKAAAVNDSAAKVKLRELNRQVEASRQIYESFLLRSRETGEQENIRSSSARLISEAVPDSDKVGPKRKVLVATGAIAGTGVGMLFALIPLFLAAGRQMALNGSGNGLSHPESSHRIQAAAPPIVGDLYSSEPVPPSRGGQLPLPGLGEQGRHMVNSAASPTAQPQNAPPMYYENWRH
ncbi:MAG: GumC family protein [Rhizobiaceae bacterium]